MMELESAGEDLRCEGLIIMGWVASQRPSLPKHCAGEDLRCEGLNIWAGLLLCGLSSKAHPVAVAFDAFYAHSLISSALADLCR